MAALLSLRGRLQVGDELLALLGVSHRAQGHLVARNGGLRARQEFIERFVRPDNGRGFHRIGKCEVGLSSDLAPEETVKRRPRTAVVALFQTMTGLARAKLPLAGPQRLV